MHRMDPWKEKDTVANQLIAKKRKFSEMKYFKSPIVIRFIDCLFYDQ